jgi:branched-chain amino acid aminotransferase
VRAAHGGIGAAKTGGNYAASLHAYAKTLDIGCDQTMWLDSIDRQYVEEMSGMNFFAVVDGGLVTPPLSDSILAGITRGSIIDLARSKHLRVSEERIAIKDLFEKIKTGACTEAFVCGTAAVLVPIASFRLKDGTTYHLSDADGKLSLQLREDLISMQGGKTPAPAGWLQMVPAIDY